MAKTKTQYSCNDCGALAPKWSGQCTDCGAWNSFSEVVVANKKTTGSRLSGYAGVDTAEIIALKDVSVEHIPRRPTGLSELDRTLGGGIIPGMVVLIGGDPGIGKSTLLLQSVASFNQGESLYITGEESLSQVSLRATRLGLKEPTLNVLAETQVEKMIALADTVKPRVMVVDSIQTLFTDSITSAPGSVSQVRESAALLVRYAKRTNTALYIVGHVTKEGTLAGPRVLEHMVDAVLYFEGQSDSRFRVIRAIKNRFGAVNEIGVFAMTDKGLKGVNNPSALFLSRSQEPVSGSVVMVTWEGSRPLMIEVQALVDESHLGNPRRVTVGLDSNRLALLLAVLNRHGGISIHSYDVFLNVVGGVRITETGADLAVIFSIISSFKNKILDPQLFVFGEIGLGGEIRPVQSGQERIKEAAKHGFTTAIVPKANAPKVSPEGLKVIAVDNIQQALEYV